MRDLLVDIKIGLQMLAYSAEKVLLSSKRDRRTPTGASLVALRVDQSYAIAHSYLG
jgi:hypothetical protein